MYQVFNQGYVVASYRYFIDAWLCAVLDFPSVYSKIKGPDGIWIVNPKTN